MYQKVARSVLIAITCLIAHSVHAEIIYSGPDQEVILDQFNPLQTIDIAGSPSCWDDLRIGLWINANPSATIHTWAATLPFGLGNHVMPASSKGMVDLFSACCPVNSSLSYSRGTSSFFKYNPSFKKDSDDSIGNFINQTGYVGLKLINRCDEYYGWIRISVENYSTADVRLIVHEWAYENSVGKEIESIDQTVVPEPSSMAMTLVCACGVFFIRRIFLI